MTIDPMQKATAGEDLLGKIQNFVAGFFGYYDRERRRDADKMLRDVMAQRFGEQLKRVERVQAQMASSGQLELVDDVDRAAIKLRTFADRVRNAPRGYTGYFDAVRIHADELERLYQYDLAMLEALESVESAVSRLEETVGTDEAPAAIESLVGASQAAIDAYNRRAEVVLTE